MSARSTVPGAGSPRCQTRPVAPAYPVTAPASQDPSTRAQSATLPSAHLEQVGFQQARREHVPHARDEPACIHAAPLRSGRDHADIAARLWALCSSAKADTHRPGTRAVYWDRLGTRAWARNPAASTPAHARDRPVKPCRAASTGRMLRPPRHGLTSAPPASSSRRPPPRRPHSSISRAPAAGRGPRVPAGGGVGQRRRGRAGMAGEGGAHHQRRWSGAEVEFPFCFCAVLLPPGPASANSCSCGGRPPRFGSVPVHVWFAVFLVGDAHLMWTCQGMSWQHLTWGCRALSLSLSLSLSHSWFRFTS